MSVTNMHKEQLMASHCECLETRSGPNDKVCVYVCLSVCVSCLAHFFVATACPLGLGRVNV